MLFELTFIVFLFDLWRMAAKVESRFQFSFFFVFRTTPDQFCLFFKEPNDRANITLCGINQLARFLVKLVKGELSGRQPPVVACRSQQ